jgi:hypothetical protein
MEIIIIILGMWCAGFFCGIALGVNIKNVK